MAKISIDGKEYDLDDLSDEAKNQIVSLRFVDSELSRIQAQAATLQTARLAYSRALKTLLEEGKKEDEPEIEIEGLGESIEFDD